MQRILAMLHDPISLPLWQPPFALVNLFSIFVTLCFVFQSLTKVSSEIHALWHNLERSVFLKKEDRQL